ncbi:MAG: hypothetical protein ACI8ZB_005050 [Desulforhopalus sp.]|jgi:hypothetical protein
MNRQDSTDYQQILGALRYILFFAACSLCLQGCVVPSQVSRTLQELNPSLQKSSLQNTPRQTTEPVSYYAGYSKKYVPYREKLAAGDTESVMRMMEAEENKIKSKDDSTLASKLRLVGLMERASLSLQLGKPDKTLTYCRLGQDLIEERERESILKGGIYSLGSIGADFFGAGEYGRYNAPGYEKVMFLDLASMAYLLKGDDRAFNIARLAIEWQDDEKEKFAAELENEIKDKGDTKKELDTNQKRNSERLFSALNDEFSKYNSAALSVPNAFVNPFGDYITGMVNEFKSVKLKSLVSNAHIAYKQALRLNPNSAVLKQAVKDTKARKPVNRLIHVVALDGFVPEKKVLSIPIDENIDVELPTYTPITSRVSKIKVMTSSNKTLATLSLVADVEALALRHQKDSLPYIQTMVLTSVLRDTAMVATGNALMSGLGGLVKSFTDSSQEPDTTSWMTLPSTVLAARIYAPKGLKTLKVRSYNSQNKMIAEKIIKLNEGGQHFVLVRSINETLYAYPSKKIWSPKT